MAFMARGWYRPNSLLKYTKRSYYIVRNAFDKKFYASTYPQVAESGIDLIEHYLNVGWAQGLNPHPKFDTLYYRASNPDVERAKINPFVHFLLHGREEGRAAHGIDASGSEFAREYFIIAPEFDVKYYLSEYQDVKNANIDPIKHFIRGLSP
jgi:hypothetical protein